jgi:hypothetical protein
MRTVHVVALLVLSAGVAPAATAEKGAPKPAGKLSEVKEMPNRFTFADG